MNSDTIDLSGSDIDDDRARLLEEKIEVLKSLIEESDKRNKELLELLTMASQNTPADDSEISGGFYARVRVLFSFLVVLLSTFASINVFYPLFLEQVFKDTLNIWTGLAALGFAVIMSILPKPKKPREDTFLDIDKSFSKQSERIEITGSGRNKVINIAASGAVADALKEIEEVPAQSIGASSDFEFSVGEIVDYLGGHIKLAESKASKLLDKGTTYLRRGLYFYIGAIVIWQVWGHFVGFGGLVITGIISTSIAFIIIEFLAAWFLKQYRSFVDSSMAYMRVQSYFNRCLLLYFAAQDFDDGEDGANLAEAKLLKLLSQDIKWPELKDVNANDFNYMLEAMGSMHTSFEKLKGVLHVKNRKGR